MLSWQQYYVRFLSGVMEQIHASMANSSVFLMNQTAFALKAWKSEWMMRCFIYQKQCMEKRLYLSETLPSEIVLP